MGKEVKVDIIKSTVPPVTISGGKKGGKKR